MREPMDGAHAPARRTAVPPSQCQLCVPVVRVVEDSLAGVISETAHEAGCINLNTNPQSRAEINVT